MAAYATEAREFTKSLNIWQKIAYVMANAHRVPKTGYNDYHKYWYVTEADLTDHLRPLMAEAGLILLSTLADDERRTEPTRRGETYVVTARMIYTVVDIDTGEKHEFTLKAEGQDDQDKCFYKAYTGGNKYAVLKTFQISTGDDPEKDAGASQGGGRDTGSAGDRSTSTGDSRSQNRDRGRGRQAPPPSQRTEPDPAGGNPTPQQQANRDRARAEQAQRQAASEESQAAAQPDATPVTAETKKELDDLVADKRIPEERRTATQSYLARHVSDLTEVNAKTLITRLRTFLPKEEA